MQSDGNFVVYKGPDFEHRIHHIWSHGKTSTGNQFFAYMQGDGNFAVYKGTSLPTRQEYLWGCLDKSLPNGRYFAVIQDDGNFMIYSGNSIQNRGNVIWESGRVVEHKTEFDPKVYGFKFANRFHFTIPLVINEIDISGLGFCGGMCAGALHRFNMHIPVEKITTPPAEHTSLYKELLARQITSMPFGLINEVLNWQIYPDTGSKPSIKPHSVSHRTKEEWKNSLRKRLDAGKPTILVLIRAKAGVSSLKGLLDPLNIRNLSNNHQVLATGYEYNEKTQDLIINFYDPNYPDQVHHLAINLKKKNIGTRDSTGKKLRGFFVNPYGDKASR